MASRENGVTAFSLSAWRYLISLYLRHHASHILNRLAARGSVAESGDNDVYMAWRHISL